MRWSQLSVTLHVSVWVEITVMRHVAAFKCVTLHVSVWVEMSMRAWALSSISSRSTWACELKSFVLDLLTSAMAVTLHVSVWVEIIVYTGFPSDDISSRSTWACELKCGTARRICGLLCHAPRERVSWNTKRSGKWTAIQASRSTWACELK